MSNRRENREGKDVQAWRTDLSVPVPPMARTTRVASWIGWHFLELSGVSVPAVLAVSVTPWAWLVSGVVGAGWAAHGVRTALEQAQIKRSATPLRRASEEHGSDADAVHGAVDGAVDDVVDGPAPDAEDTGVSGGRGVSGGAA